MAKQPAGSGPSQRMLRVAEEVRHALSAVFTRGEIHDEALYDTRITVTEVRSSPDLKHMTCFVSALGRKPSAEELEGLRRIQPWLRKQVAHAVRLKFAPQLHFQPDEALEYAAKIETVMRRPEVQQDLHPATRAPEVKDDEEA
ncbi:30S ribosome-binding factor RbfA [Pseudoroseomonas wenyumeiae]|uniref:Ribosome-binding factor A n=1 Tax=Teichococcus wenyumeiae TaxID=2478470 RepID=A0A3A9JDG2_9PROT|nr:30S ribosome-binding factor RbfA [Pseudoroseomonas wenyumeiae]RKK02605.1 30S ribosome-binding factor RbfA [Pseudoroseomonas wenyumeiae]RMI26889.1 30S ribosome-binding factor RbfA [Pseudoroseomonas wenyumeiae]